MTPIKSITIFALLMFQVYGLSAQQQKYAASYEADIKTWTAARDAALRSEASPLGLLGTYYLKEGINNFGSATDNQIVIPDAVVNGHAGQYLLTKDSVVLSLRESKGVVVEGRTAVLRSTIPQQDSLKYRSDTERSIVLRQGPVRWFLLNNNGRIAIRALNAEAVSYKNFHGVERYPVDPSWRIPATFSPDPSNSELEIINVLGQKSSRALAGKVRFELDGQHYALDALTVDSNLFIVFSDGTSNKGTYTFRFLYADKPVSGNQTTLDFNKAINPNCAFSPYSACPMPPPNNRLKVAVTAGEKRYSNDVK